MEGDTVKTSEVRIAEIQGRGKALVATQPIQAGNDGTVDSQAHVLHSLMLSVISFWPVQGTLLGFSSELTASLLSKDKQNAFGLMAPVQQGAERQVRAYAIYAQASFFNHDCLPNACKS
ncbi:hypothetical protein KI387_024876, partial [Taxus chinensis]